MMCLSKPLRRERKCPRCRLHGITVPQKNHTRTCPFLRCDCWKCLQVRAEVRGPQPGRPQDQEQQRPEPGEAPPSATSPEPAAGGPLDLRCRAAGGGGREARLERSQEPPPTPTAAFNAPSSNEMMQIPPQPFFPLTVLLPVYHPETFAPYPAFYCATLWVTPVPAACFHQAPPGPYPLLPPAADAFWRRYLLNPSPPPPPINPYPSPPARNPYPSPPPMNPYPSPPPEGLQPLSPGDREVDMVEVD